MLKLTCFKAYIFQLPQNRGNAAQTAFTGYQHEKITAEF